jgi:hypothetical protein
MDHKNYIPQLLTGVLRLTRLLNSLERMPAGGFGTNSQMSGSYLISACSMAWSTRVRVKVLRG